MARRAVLMAGTAFGAALGAAMLAAPAVAQLALAPAGRVAIVVGNGDYAAIPDLPNAVGDAQSIAAMLQGFGYDVFAATDLDRRGFEQLLRQTIMNIPAGSDVVFFYAGHGIQIGARNYLLPTDVDFTDVHDLPLYSITLDRVIDALSTRGSVHVAFIDACRDNPFPDLRISADMDTSLFETREGFEPFRTPLNSLISFSTAPGAVARDGGEGENSPYTAAILATATAEPTEPVLTLLSEVREKVYAATGGAQVPWESSTLVGPFRLVDSADEIRVADADEPEGEGSDGPDRGAPGAPEEIAASADLMLDRYLRLDPALEEAAGGPLVAPEIADAPRFGEVAIDPASGAVYFRPRLQEIRAADEPGYTLTDSLRILTGPPESRAAITLDLTLTPDPCDVQAGDALDLDGSGLFRYPNEIDVDAALAACTAAVAAHPDIARFQYQLGRAQRAATDFEAAYASFQRAADAGHARAKNALAAMLFSRRIDREVFDVPYDPDRADALLEEAIAAGDPYAMQTLGGRLMQSGETPEEIERGYELVDRSAELGHTYAMNSLGFWFLNDDSDHFVPERGIAYFTASAARADIYGYQGLALAALEGAGTGTPDYAAAFDYYRMAATGGHPTAPGSIGRMILRGELGTPADGPQALGWFDMGLARGDGSAGIAAARLILDGGAGSGLGPADAAIRAARTALLPNEDSAAAARDLLAGQSAEVLGTALQMQLVELGANITVDGSVGPATLDALAALRRDAGLDPAIPADPADRLIAAAQVHFAREPVRPDVF